MKRKTKPGYCMSCGRSVVYSDSILPLTVNCPLCGARILSYKTLTGKLVIYTVTDSEIIKSVTTMPKEGKNNESV